jgi:hypothetical protein
MGFGGAFHLGPPSRARGDFGGCHLSPRAELPRSAVPLWSGSPPMTSRRCAHSGSAGGGFF